MRQFYLRAVACAFWAWLFGGVWCFAHRTDSLHSFHSLSEVEVTAVAAGGESGSTVPLQALQSADFARLGLSGAADALKRMAGVQVHDYGGIGGLKTVSVRGLGAKHTAVTYDGIALGTSQSGIVDIGRFTLDNVSQLSMEVGQSNIFAPARSFASAGAVNITTVAPEKNRIVAKATAGSFGSVGGVLTGEWVASPVWSASGFVNAQSATGDYPFELVNGVLTSKLRRTNSDVQNITAEGNLFGNFGERGRLQAKVHFHDSERGLPGSVKYYARGNNERLWDDNLFLQAAYKVAVNENLLLRALAKYNYSFTRYIEINNIYAAGRQVDANTQNDYYASFGAHYTLSRGFSISVASDYEYSALKNNFSLSKSPVRHNWQGVVAAQYENKALEAVVSLLSTVVSDRLQNATSPATRKRLSPALSLAWQPLHSVPLRLRASVKDAYRIPTFADLYYLRLGNVGLRPERATLLNAGFVCDATIGRSFSLSFTLDGYINNVRDKIVALPTMYIWRMQNYGKVRIKGLDATLHSTLLLPCDASLQVDATYSYCRAADNSNPAARNYGHQLPYTPRHTATGSLTLNNRWVNLSWLLTAAGKRYMLPLNSAENEMAAYVEHSLSANKEFLVGGVGVRLQGELLNFTNVNYDIIRYYPMPGRSWRLSAIVTF